MQNRKLGSGGFSVSEVGLGCWQIGSDWGDGISKEKAFSILQAAVDHGITFFDTADVYGAGKSESVIGEFLKEYDRPIRVATKFGRSADVFPNNYSVETLRKTIEGSLSRLGLSELDLLQLHCVPTSVLREGEIFHWLKQIKKEGLIKHYGASVETVEEGLICLEDDELLSLQVIFNIFRQKLLTDLLPQAKEKGVGIIVRLPLASGLLSGKYNLDTKFSESDHRNFNKDGAVFNVGETFAGLPFEKGIELTNNIGSSFLKEGMTMIQFALRWILDHEAVSCIIPGATSPTQAMANAEVSEMAPLPLQVHTELQEYYKQHIHDHIRGAY